MTSIANLNLEVNLSPDERSKILENAKVEYQRSHHERRVDAVVVYGAILDGSNPPFYTGFASGASGHWGVVIDNFLHHLVFIFDDDGKPTGIEFEVTSFKQRWMDNGRCTELVPIGTTNLSLNAISAICIFVGCLLIPGEALIQNFGSYKRLYRNCQDFAELLIELVCLPGHRNFLSLPLSNIIAKTLIAFPMTTVGGTLMKIKQQKNRKATNRKTKADLSWESLVDAEIEEELREIGLTKPSKCIIS